MLPDRIPASRFKDFVDDPDAVVDARCAGRCRSGPYRATRLGTAVPRLGRGAGPACSRRPPSSIDARPVRARRADRAGRRRARARRAAGARSRRASGAASSRSRSRPRSRCRSRAGSSSARSTRSTGADGRIEIVDWKTGRPPTSRPTLELKQFQLALYRFAYATREGIDPAHDRRGLLLRRARPRRAARAGLLRRRAPRGLGDRRRQAHADRVLAARLTPGVEHPLDLGDASASGSRSPTRVPAVPSSTERAAPRASAPRPSTITGVAAGRRRAAASGRSRAPRAAARAGGEGRIRGAAADRVVGASRPLAAPVPGSPSTQARSRAGSPTRSSDPAEHAGDRVRPGPPRCRQQALRPRAPPCTTQGRNRQRVGSAAAADQRSISSSGTSPVESARRSAPRTAADASAAVATGRPASATTAVGSSWIAATARPIDPASAAVRRRPRRAAAARRQVVRDDGVRCRQHAADVGHRERQPRAHPGGEHGQHLDLREQPRRGLRVDGRADDECSPSRVREERGVVLPLPAARERPGRPRRRGRERPVSPARLG